MGSFGVNEVREQICQYPDCEKKATKSLRKLYARRDLYKNAYFFCDEHENYFVKYRRKTIAIFISITMVLFIIIIVLFVLSTRQ